MTLLVVGFLILTATAIVTLARWVAADSDGWLRTPGYPPVRQGRLRPSPAGRIPVPHPRRPDSDERPPAWARRLERLHDPRVG